MRIVGILAIVLVFSLCISESPTTTPPKTTQEPTDTPTYTPPTTLPPTTTPAPIDEEEKALEEIGLPEYLIEKISKLDTDTNPDEIELYIGNKAKELLDSEISEEITGKLLIDIAYKLDGEENIEYLMENIYGHKTFEKIIENDISSHEEYLLKKLITLKDSEIVEMIDNNEKILESYETIYNEANSRDPAKELLFGGLLDRMFDKVNGKYVVDFDQYGNCNISDRLKITKNGEVLFKIPKFLTENYSNKRHWEVSDNIGEFYNYNYEKTDCKCNPDISIRDDDEECEPKNLFDKGLMDYFEFYSLEDAIKDGLELSILKEYIWIGVNPVMEKEHIKRLYDIEESDDFYPRSLVLSAGKLNNSIEEFKIYIPTEKEPAVSVYIGGRDNFDVYDKNIESLFYTKYNTDGLNHGNICITKSGNIILDQAIIVLGSSEPGLFDNKTYAWVSLLDAYVNQTSFSETSEDLAYIIEGN